MKQLIILGAGGFARELYYFAQESLGYGVDWDIKGFLDGDVKLPDEEYLKLPAPVLGDIYDYAIEDNDVFVCGVGMPEVRKIFIEAISKRGGTFANVIHKTAIIQKSARLGVGIVVLPWSTINANAIVGDHLLITLRSTISHDCTVGNNVCIMGDVSICGYVDIKDDSFMAVGSTALPHSKIGKNAYVGVASVVFKSVKDNQKAFGNPARSI